MFSVALIQGVFCFLKDSPPSYDMKMLPLTAMFEYDGMILGAKLSL
jgi:hypothetical protein